jgi:hypothetical protein
MNRLLSPSPFPVGTPAALNASAFSMRNVNAPGDQWILETLATEVLAFVTAGDFFEAVERFADFETAMTKDEPRLRPLNPGEWMVIEYAADVAGRSLRASRPIDAEARTDLIALIVALQDLPVS